MYIKSNSKFKANLYLQNNVVGIIVPDPEVMPGWAEKEGISPDMTELCKNKVTIQRTMSSEFFLYLILFQTAENMLFLISIKK